MDRLSYTFQNIPEKSGRIDIAYIHVYYRIGILDLQVLPLWLIPAYSKIFHFLPGPK